MRELRLKYIIQMVSDIGARSKSDAQALQLAQKAVQEALGKSTKEAGLLERAIVRMGGMANKSADQQAQYLARLALRYQEVRKAAEGAATAMQRTMAIGSGAAAGAYALDRMTRAPMDYSMRLAHMANTAYADRDAAGRIAGKRTLDSAINASVRVGGGSRDAAAGALDTLIASGAVSPDQAVRLLPMLMRGSTASGAAPDQLAGIALRGMQTFDLRVDQIPEALNMAMVGGQAGGFELRDMARWLPQAMAAGKLSGLSGMEGMRRIVASMQAGVIVAGSKDEAGNNLVNLLAKINSRDTAVDLEKMGIDLPGTLASERSKGVNSLDAFIGIVDGIASKDEQYTKLKRKLDAGGTPGERTQTLQAMTDILQGSAIGKVIQDRQALMQLVAEMNNRPYVQGVMSKTRGNTGAMGTSFDVIAQELGFKREQALNEAAIGAQTAVDAAGPALGAVATGAAGAAQQFPILTATVIGATGAIAVFAAALGASGLVGMLTGRAGNAGGVLRTAATLATGGASLAATKLLTGGPWWARAGGVFAAPVIGAGIDVYSAATNEQLTAQGRTRGYAQAGAGLGGGLAGALAGAAAGSLLFPGVGTLVGGVLGGLGGSWAGKAGLDALWAEDPARDLIGPDGTAMVGGGKIELGKGSIDVNVRVADDRVRYDLATQGTPAVGLQAGNTNPAGYGPGTGGPR